MMRVVRLLICALLLPAVLASSTSCPCGDDSLCQPLTTPAAHKQVYAFDPCPSYPCTGWAHMDWDSITTVCFCGAAPRELVCDAHRRGVRAVVLTGLMPEVANETSVAAWINTTVSNARLNGTDGVNLDIEGYGNYKVPVPKDTLTSMVANMSSAMRLQNPFAQISIDATPLPQNGYWWTGYDWLSLSQHVDFLLPMMYDMLNVDACSRGNCSLAPRYSPFSQSALPMHQETVQQYGDLGVPASKIVLGVPWYGYAIPCASQEPSTPCQLPVPWPSDPVGGWPCGSLADPWCCPKQVPYAKILEAVQAQGSGRWLNYDPTTVTAYLDTHNETGGRIQLWFDNPQTLSVKAHWMREAGVHGVAMWTASSLNYSYATAGDVRAMWEALRIL